MFNGLYNNLEAIKYLLTIENGAFQISNFDDDSRADFSLQMLGESRKKITFANRVIINLPFVFH